MRVFVTGGTGFVGAHVVPMLVTRGHDVICLVRDPEKAESRFDASTMPRLVRGDLRDAAALADGWRGADAGVHPGTLTAARSRDEMFAVNAEGTSRVVAAVRGRGDRA